MSDLLQDPFVKSIIDVAVKKKRITYSELNDSLPDDITTSESLDEIISYLESVGLIEPLLLREEFGKFLLGKIELILVELLGEF